MRISRTLMIASAGWSNRIIAALVQIVSIPLFIRLLGLDGYAAFSVVSGFICWFALAEIGLGSVLQNEISARKAKNQSLDGVLELYISILIFITIACIVLYVPLSFLINHWLSNTFGAYRNLLMVAGGLYILLLNSNVIYKIFFAKHLGYISYLFQSIGNLLWFGIILLLTFWHELKFSPELIIVITLIPQICVSLYLYTRLNLNWQQIHVIPNLARLKQYKVVLAKSMNFFWVSLTSNFVLGVDYFFIAKFLNQHEIITYNIINKIYIFVAFGYSVLLAALWPILSELYALGEQSSYKKANVTLLKYIFSAFLYVIFASLLIVVLRGYIATTLAKSTIEISIELIVLFCIYYCIRVMVDFICVALQSRGQVRILMITAPLQAIITVYLMSLFVNKYSLLGIMYALILGFILTAFWMLPVAYIRGNRRAS
jgi:O-antigen/teichoic acid export membrane protein